METQTLIRTGFADQGREIETEALHEICSAVRSTIWVLTWERLAALRPDLFSADSPKLDFVEFYVEAPDKLAGDFGRALDVVDLAWRLGWLVAEMPSGLPDVGGTTNLDELIPVESYGIEVESLEIGSLKAWLKSPVDSYDRAISTLSIIVSIAGFNVHQAFFADAQAPGGDSCRVEIVGELDEENSKTIQEHLPGLPAKCQVRATYKFDDGTVIHADVPAGALPER